MHRHADLHHAWVILHAGQAADAAFGKLQLDALHGGVGVAKGKHTLAQARRWQGTEMKRSGFGFNTEQGEVVARIGFDKFGGEISFLGSHLNATTIGDQVMAG